MIKHKLPQRLADAKAAGWSRWIKNEADERAVMDGCYFDKAAAAHIVHFFEKYRMAFGDYLLLLKLDLYQEDFPN